VSRKLLRLLPVYNRGQSLIEVIIAIAIATLIIVALINATITGMKNAQFSRNKETSVKLSQEGMEWIRVQRDNLSWDAFNDPALLGQTLCLNTLSNWSLLTSANSDCSATDLNCGYSLGNNIFKRMFFINTDAAICPPNGSDNPLKITVTVCWKDSTSTVHKSEQTSCFSNWQNK